MITLLAHGSPDIRHSRDVGALASRVRAAGHDATVAYLEHDAPTAAGAAAAMAGAGVTATTVVPLLLGPAYHARVDVPRAAESMRAAVPGLVVEVAPPVGLHGLVVDALAELVTSSGVEVGQRTGLILAGTGARDAHATGRTGQFLMEHAGQLYEALGVSGVAVAFLDGGPSLRDARDELRAQGCVTLLMATAVIAEGLLRDRLVDAAAELGIRSLPGALAATRSMADLVVTRAGQTA